MSLAIIEIESTRSVGALAALTPCLNTDKATLSQHHWIFALPAMEGHLPSS